MFNLDDCIACITSRGAKDLAYRLEKRFEPHNVTRVQWFAMYYVGQNRKLTQKQLADKMMLKEPTVVRLLDRMGKEGLILRKSSPEDKRLKYLELTPKGEELNKTLIVIAEQFKNDAISGIAECDLAIFKEVLAKMLVNTQ